MMVVALPIDVIELMLSVAAFKCHRHIERPAGRDGSAHTGKASATAAAGGGWAAFLPRQCDVGDPLKGHIDGRLGHKQEGLVQEEQVPFVRFQRALDPGLLVMASKVARRSGDLPACQALEDLRDHLVGGVFVVHLELPVVLLLQSLLGDVQVEVHVLFPLELHHEEGVFGLALPQRRLQPDHNHVVDLVGLREQEKLLHVVELDLVVVRLSPETEGRLVHVDVVPSSGAAVSGQTSKRRVWKDARTWG